MVFKCKNIIWNVDSDSDLPKTLTIKLDDDLVKNFKSKKKIHNAIISEIEDSWDTEVIDFVQEDVNEDNTAIYVVSIIESNGENINTTEVLKAFKTKEDAMNYVKKSLDESNDYYQKHNIEVAEVDYDCNCIIVNEMSEYMISKVNLK